MLFASVMVWPLAEGQSLEAVDVPLVDDVVEDSVTDDNELEELLEGRYVEEEAMELDDTAELEEKTEEVDDTTELGDEAGIPDDTAEMEVEAEELDDTAELEEEPEEPDDTTELKEETDALDEAAESKRGADELVDALAESGVTTEADEEIKPEDRADDVVLTVVRVSFSPAILVLKRLAVLANAWIPDLRRHCPVPAPRLAPRL